MPKSDLRLDILGTSFSITADEERAYLEEILAQYGAALERTQEQTGLTDPLKLAILTGYLLSDEVYKLKNRSGQEAEELTLDLIARIDEALENRA
ncbi:MAG: cell division protein ZapA [Treponema sp.]|jgi:cell division protein ZapA (FtsZ GTPase activity inhibitor)|nr:cell division protein ZapA [Treponema sp.]